MFFKRIICIFSLLLCNTCLTKSIKVCSAENFYGNVADMIGGKFVSVTNIISNPNSDPHLFSISPEIAIAIADAQVVIYNGADYDPWMTQFLSAQPSNNKLAVINMAELLGIKEGNNPHVWYNPQAFPTLAKFLAEKFSVIQPDHRSYFENNLKSFNTSYKTVVSLIDDIKSKHSGTSVIATEPVFCYMSDALGFYMKEKEFQLVIMNGSNPSPKMIADFTNQIENKKIKILFYNNQVTDSTTKYILDFAKKHGIKIVGVSETMPEKQNVIEWLIDELKEVQKALDDDN